MKKVLCITNSYPIHPRLRKIGSLFKGADVQYLGWDRTCQCQQAKPDEWVHQSNEGYGTAVQVLKGMIPFIRFARQTIKTYQPDVIVLRHWSTAFLLLPVLPKKVKVVYDVSDMPDSDAPIPQWIYRRLEQLVVWRSQHLIFSSSYYQPFYPKVQKKTMVLENRASLQLAVRRSLKSKPLGERLVVSYIGMVRYFETLVPLVEAVQGLAIDLKFYGTGSEVDRLREYCQAKGYADIYFHGAYDYQNIHQYYQEADLIYGAYPSHNVNVQVSIPNRYFESIVFEKPLIASQQTAVGDLVEAHGIGYAVNGYESDEIRQLFQWIIEHREDLEKKRAALQMYPIERSVFWEDYQSQVEWMIE